MSAPNIDIADCGNLRDHYAAAVNKVMEALRTYQQCIAASDGRNECAAEIQALDDAHDDFADALADAKGCK